MCSSGVVALQFTDDLFVLVQECYSFESCSIVVDDNSANNCGVRDIQLFVLLILHVCFKHWGFETFELELRSVDGRGMLVLDLANFDVLF